MVDQLELYKDCITKQLEEVDMLSSIYCSPGEMHIFDPGVISDFNEFLQQPCVENLSNLLKSQLDYNIKLDLQTSRGKTNLEVRIELPHLYPRLENAIVIVHTTLLSINLDTRRNRSISDASEFETSEVNVETNAEDELVDFERLWIYSHHIKSKTKRQEIVKQSRNLDLTGFMRPGKPGIICVEGLKECTQEFWRIIKSMNWQKICICTIESRRKPRVKMDELRRFSGFKEQLFCDDMENEEGVMNMGLFLKYLEQHKSGYMKKELFGLK
ncbi:RWD domain-containing protein 2A [Lucilia cuprina]|nr:RWD domain-containing protein 2A [Lucilia cuprina]